LLDLFQGNLRERIRNLDAIYANHLLWSRMMRARKNARLYGRIVRSDPADSPDVGSFAPQNFYQLIPRLIRTDCPGNRDAATQIQQVIGGIRCTARHAAQIAIFQHENRRFTRDSRDASVEKLVGYQVPHYEDLAARESTQDIQ
jgi:hypothetical protein